MEILLSNGKTIVVDDDAYTMTDDYSGSVTHIFTSKKTGTLYTVKDENITAFGEKWTAERMDRLVGEAGGDTPVLHDCMFG